MLRSTVGYLKVHRSVKLTYRRQKTRIQELFNRIAATDSALQSISGYDYQGVKDPIVGMTDSDWSVRRSTSGWIFMLSSAAISWGSKRQISVALSSCEAEIMAASEASKEAMYLKRFAEELELVHGSPIELFEDNKGARDLAYNPEHHSRTKHIDRRHFYVRELVERGEIVVPFVKTDDNLADFFTKALPAKRFFALRDKIMNVPRPS